MEEELAVGVGAEVEDQEASSTGPKGEVQARLTLLTLVSTPPSLRPLSLVPKANRATVAGIMEGDIGTPLHRQVGPPRTWLRTGSARPPPPPLCPSCKRWCVALSSCRGVQREASMVPRCRMRGQAGGMCMDPRLTLSPFLIHTSLKTW